MHVRDASDMAVGLHTLGCCVCASVCATYRGESVTRSPNSCLAEIMAARAVKKKTHAQTQDVKLTNIMQPDRKTAMWRMPSPLQEKISIY